MNITHEEYRRAINDLANAVVASGRFYTKIFGVPRGGYYPAIELAAALAGTTKLITDPGEIDAATLIVDDLVDGGETMRKWKEQTGCHFAAAFVKDGAPEPDYYGRKVAREWLAFPDEKANDIEGNIVRVMEYIGEDTTREGLLETPSRVRRALDEIFAGYKTDPHDLVKTFTQGTCKEMVILKRAEFYSTCEHHMFPFFGHCSIGYIPNEKVIGVSKLARLLDCFSKRMQIQERMTSQIADFLETELGARGVYVVAEGQHFCMTSRGVKKQDASMVTSAIRGLFEESASARAEFLSLIK